MRGPTEQLQILLHKFKNFAMHFLEQMFAFSSDNRIPCQHCQLSFIPAPHPESSSVQIQPQIRSFPYRNGCPAPTPESATPQPRKSSPLLQAPGEPAEPVPDSGTRRSSQAPRSARRYRRVFPSQMPFSGSSPTHSEAAGK